MSFLYGNFNVLNVFTGEGKVQRINPDQQKFEFTIEMADE